MNDGSVAMTREVIQETLRMKDKDLVVEEILVNADFDGGQSGVVTKLLEWECGLGKVGINYTPLQKMTMAYVSDKEEGRFTNSMKGQGL